MKKLIALLIVLLLATPIFAQTTTVEATDAAEVIAGIIDEASGAGWLMISVEKAQEQMDAIEPVIIDVRKPSEIEELGKIAGSINIPVTELENNLFQLPPDKSTPIIVYCAAGTRGLYGTIFLKSLGFENVKDLKGGFKAWAAGGYPIVK